MIEIMNSFRLIVWAAIALPLSAETWTKLTTPHFELYTTNGEKKGREALLHFEQVRSFFLQISPSLKTAETPVRIIAFRSEKEYQPYRPNEVAVAYYTGSQKRDYIVMRDLSVESYPVAVHEFTHLIMRHTGIKIPLWFNEGFADLFSTLKAVGDHARVGEPLPGRMQTALREKWIPLKTLSEIDHTSGAYNEKNQAGMFYAESWAVTHLLFLGHDYHEKFGQFLMSVGSSPLPELLQQLYGKSTHDVETEAIAALTNSSITVGNFAIKLQKSDEDVTVSEASNQESGLALADLLAALRKTDAAKSAFERLAQAGSKDPELESGLGYLAWQMKDVESARSHFAKAFDYGSKDPTMCYHYAGLVLQGNASPKAAIPVLERAVELKPDYVDARLRLASIRNAEGDFAGAIAECKKITRTDVEHAFTLFSTLAYAHERSRNFDDARKYSESAKKYAKTESQKAEVDSMLSFLDSRQKNAGASFSAPDPIAPTNPFVNRGEKVVRAEGTAKELECSGTGARLHVVVDGKELVLGIPDPSRVLIKHSGGDKVDFECGPQKGYKVAVEYAPKENPAEKTVGVVKSLEF